MTHSENLHDDVYGATFSRYSLAELEQFMAPFHKRLLANGVDPSALFRGKLVLDAGCGGGRGSLLALRHQAAHVEAIDFSQTNVATTCRVLDSTYGNYCVRQGTLAQLPYPDATFDLVWCNGVLMHTAQPASALSEIIRVLKPSGLAWIYVYGRGGVYWRIIAMLRRIFFDVPASELIPRLASEGLPNGRIAEMIDDWKAPYLRTYSQTNWEVALLELGCSSTRLMHGMDYDTSEQLARGRPPDLLGEGDLRFLVTKQEAADCELSPSASAALNDSHLDLTDFAPIADAWLEERLATALKAFEDRWSADPLGGVAPAAAVQLVLRNEFLRQPVAASVDRLVEVLSD